MKKGQIIKIISGFFDIKTDDKIYRLRASGTLRDNNINPLVGDFVLFEENELLNNICERKNSLIRPRVANVDQVAIVVSLCEPKFSSLLLDKFIATIESQNIETIILFTKADIGDDGPYHEYKKQGFKCLLIDNNNPDKKYWDNIRKNFKNKLIVLTGQSGVGKTTTINNLLCLNEKTQEISQALGRGKHTTRVVEIFFYKNISIIDTPGFGSIKINLTKQELAKSFFDFKEWSKSCKFKTCIHYKENDCEIKRKLNEGKLSKSRYDNYIKILLEDND